MKDADLISLEHCLLRVNDITLSLYSAGPEQGRPVWLLHGFPECWHSWRNQIAVLAESGYRVLVPEMRGYGQSSAPPAPADYDLLTICSDIQAAMDALRQQQACVIGHDWGAPVACHLALLEPSRVKALCVMSVPFGGRPKRPAIDIMRQLHANKFNYILYFQEPGVAEAELNADIARTLRYLMFSGPSEVFLQDKPADARLFEGLTEPHVLPDWCTERDFSVYLDTFTTQGFQGALNWYRNFERNWERTDFLAGCQVEQPTLFLLGDCDPVGKLESYTLQRMTEVIPDLEQHLLADCGHWIQNEQAEKVNTLLMQFLARKYAIT